MKKEKITVSKIAELAGVSPATVSRVLNHRSIVKESTIRQVEDAISGCESGRQGEHPVPEKYSRDLSGKRVSCKRHHEPDGERAGKSVLYGLRLQSLL